MIKTEHALAGLTIATLTVGIYFSLDTEIIELSECHAHTKRYVVAEFSEVSTSIDSEGYVSTDVDYWEEDASEVWEAITVNGELEFSSSDSVKSEYGIFYPTNYPPVTIDYSKDFDFDRNKKKLSEQVTIYFTDSERTMSEGVKNYPKCIENIGKLVYVKTWFGMPYSIEY